MYTGASFPPLGVAAGPDPVGASVAGAVAAGAVPFLGGQALFVVTVATGASVAAVPVQAAAEQGIVVVVPFIMAGTETELRMGSTLAEPETAGDDMADMADDMEAMLEDAGP